MYMVVLHQHMTSSRACTLYKRVYLWLYYIQANVEYSVRRVERHVNTGQSVYHKIHTHTQGTLQTDRHTHTRHTSTTDTHKAHHTHRAHHTQSTLHTHKHTHTQGTPHTHTQGIPHTRHTTQQLEMTKAYENNYNPSIYPRI